MMGLDKQGLVRFPCTNRRYSKTREKGENHCGRKLFSKREKGNEENLETSKSRCEGLRSLQLK